MNLGKRPCCFFIFCVKVAARINKKLKYPVKDLIVYCMKHEKIKKVTSPNIFSVQPAVQNPKLLTKKSSESSNPGVTQEVTRDDSRNTSGREQFGVKVDELMTEYSTVTTNTNGKYQACR